MSSTRTTHYDEIEKIWHGQDTVSNFNPDISVGQVALFLLKKFPKDNISQISDSSGKQFTSAEIATLSIRVAQHLQKLGLKQNDVIGICASNTDYLAPLALGAFASGVIISTLDPSFDKDGIKHIYGITSPKLMFCDGGIYEPVKQALDELGLDCPIYTMKDHKAGVRTIDELIQPTGDEDSFTPVTLEDGGDQTGAIICSSGTTGLPKGVCISHKALANCSMTPVTTEDVMLSFSTLYWVSGLFTLVVSTLNGSTRIITDQLFSPELFLRIIEQYRVTSILGPPSQMAMAIKCPDIEKRDLSSVNAYICGGSAVPYPVVCKMRQYVRPDSILCGYGMTEIFAFASTGIPKKSGDNGTIRSNINVKVVDDNGNKVAVGENGEICFKTKNKWAGYYNNPQATKEVYDEEGWVHSGDLGYIDEEGVLNIVDRKKDIMKYKNFHFSPSEIEQVITEIPDVIEVSVCGIPDVIASDLPAAAIVKKPGSKLTRKAVYDHVAERMAHFKHLRGGVYFLDSIPKTASGKNLRRILKETLLRMREAGDKGIDWEQSVENDISPQNGEAVTV